MSKVIVFPTDTVYGIGTPLYDNEGIIRIYEIKGRSLSKQLPVLCSSLDQINKFAVFDERLEIIANKFWPGALTVVLKTKKEYFDFSGEETIAVRIPNHKLALSIINEFGPLKTTSINQSGFPPLNDYYEIKEKYNDQVDYIYQNNEDSIGVSSTIISLVDEIELLRQGSISLDEIKSLFE